MEWPATIAEDLIEDIVAFDQTLRNHAPILDSIVAYNSLTIRYQQPVDFNATVAQLKAWYRDKKAATKQKSRLWKIPVCYDTEYGLDLAQLAEEKDCSPADIIRQHSAPTYRVYFLGFQPGFLYLGGLPAALHTPRKANPRLRVAAGSVGIGGEQTGVYPSQTSGGWNLIGRSPIRFFDIHQDPPCFAQAGDCIRFSPISKDEFQAIAHVQKHGQYTLKPHVL